MCTHACACACACGRARACVCVHLSPSERLAAARAHPSALPTHNGLVSPSFSPPLHPFAPLPRILNDGPSLLGACKHASRTIGRGAWVTLSPLAEGQSGMGGKPRRRWVVTIGLQDDGCPGRRRARTCMHARAHTHIQPQDTVRIPTDTLNTNTLRHMARPLTSSTKDLRPCKDGKDTRQ